MNTYNLFDMLFPKYRPKNEHGQYPFHVAGDKPLEDSGVIECPNSGLPKADKLNERLERMGAPHWARVSTLSDETVRQLDAKRAAIANRQRPWHTVFDVVRELVERGRSAFRTLVWALDQAESWRKVADDERALVRNLRSEVATLKAEVERYPSPHPDAAQWERERATLKTAIKNLETEREVLRARVENLKSALKNANLRRDAAQQAAGTAELAVKARMEDIKCLQTQVHRKNLAICNAKRALGVALDVQEGS